MPSQSLAEHGRTTSRETAFSTLLSRSPDRQVLSTRNCEGSLERSGTQVIEEACWSKTGSTLKVRTHGCAASQLASSQEDLKQPVPILRDISFEDVL